MSTLDHRNQSRPEDDPEQPISGNDAGTPTASGKRSQLLPER
jgi:hypothetical protein